MTDADTSPSPGLLRRAADHVEDVATRTVGGSWTRAGLLASRPEIVARLDDGGTEHVAEARERSAPWIVAASPALAAPLASWLRSTAEALDRAGSRGEVDAVLAPIAADAGAVARALLRPAPAPGSRSMIDPSAPPYPESEQE